MLKISKDKVYVLGNWKMNPCSLAEAEDLFGAIENSVYKKQNDGVEVVLCLPSVFLSEFEGGDRLKLGAQNVFWEDKGAYTGEISPKMLRGLGVDFVIVGHSERRKYLDETDEMINKKVQSVLQNDMIPVLCIGETMEEKKRGDTGEIIIGQLEKALEGVDAEKAAGRIIVAYEPVWAIGSGVTPCADEIMSACLLIKKVLNRIYGGHEVSDSAAILYGGSVSSENAQSIIDKTGMNGLLIGGSSLNASEFVNIADSF